MHRTRRLGVLALGVTLSVAAAWAVASSPVAWPGSAAESRGAAPASSKIAFISAPCHWVCSGALYVMNPDGSGQRVVRRNVWSGVAWSPDGQRFVFGRDLGIYVVNADGSGERRLTRSGGDAAWSPDGRKIAFTKFTSKISKTRPRWRIFEINEVFVVNADGSGLRKLARGTLLAWLPDGRIAFVTHTGLSVMNANGSGKRNLTREWGLAGRLVGRYFWSPDGRKIAFTSKLGLYVINADGSGLRRLTRSIGLYVNAGGSRQRRLTRPANLDAIAWSPDARKIAFVRERQRQLPRRYHSEIYVVNADGSGQRRLTQRGANPRWSPDGEKIAFRSSRDGDFELYVMNADGSEERRLTHMAQHGARVHDFAWLPARTR